jgi:hypothetical protein
MFRSLSNYMGSKDIYCSRNFGVQPRDTSLSAVSAAGVPLGWGTGGPRLLAGGSPSTPAIFN